MYCISEAVADFVGNTVKKSYYINNNQPTNNSVQQEKMMNDKKGRYDIF